MKPYFGSHEVPKNPIDLFVIMPFRSELRPVYEEHISAVARQLNLTVARGDDFFGTHATMADVWNAIAASKVVIADCSAKNSNVFYEIGIAHAIGTPVILITQNTDDVPFDLRHIRYIHYTLTPQGMKDFEKTLQSTLETELAVTPF